MPDKEPLRLPLVVGPENRDETTLRDARLINGFLEQSSKDEVWVFKRPGLLSYSAATAATGLGIYNWLGDIYSIWGNTLYKNNVAITGTLDTTARYTFSPILGATPKLFIQNGTKAYNYDATNGLVAVTDVNYPAATVPGQVYLDATMYVMTAKAAIQGSNINDTTVWQATNSLIAQIEPDGGVALAKQLVYVIAFKQWSVEAFYDAGNATGSPLGTVQGAKISVGCRSAYTIQDIEGSLLWVSQARGGSVAVYMMEGLKAQPISTPPIERLLEEADYTVVYSWSARVAGHKLYGVTLVNNNITLVYDISVGRWYQWADSNGNYLPWVSSTFSSNQRSLIQHTTNGKVYSLENMVFNDDGSVFAVDLYTPNFDGGTRKKKYMHSMDFIADQTAGSTMTVRKSDDDYQTWSNPRTVDLSKSRPRLTGMGTFRRRAHHFHHLANTAFRIKAVELQLDVGTL